MITRTMKVETTGTKTTESKRAELETASKIRTEKILSAAQGQHLRLTELVKTERKITHEVLMCVQQIDSSKAYAELGYSSLFDYLVLEHKYSEGAAQRRISAARLLKEIPEIESKIQEGRITLTQLAKLSIAVKQEQKATGQKVTTEDKKEIIESLENKNGFETEKFLSHEFHYSPKINEKIVVSGDKFALTALLNNTQLEKFKEVQSFLSHSCPDGNYAELIESMCDKILSKKKNPRNQKIKNPADHNCKPSTATTAVKFPAKTGAETEAKPRRFIPSATRKYIYHKAGYCCEYVNAETGRRCDGQYQLQLDHKVPLAKGGGNHPENLRLLCRTHNLAEARRWGLKKLEAIVKI